MPRITRREFVAAAAKGSLAATIVPRHVLGGPGYQAPSDTLGIAIIGAGGMGAQNAAQLLSENIVAICDIDFPHVEDTLTEMREHRDPERVARALPLTDIYARVPRYADFRVMLERQRDIDAVVIATPDHLHAVMAQRAMELGKHVYLQKPLTHSIHEARVLRETARRTGVVTQMGNQGHSRTDAHTVNDWIRGGAIGPVRDIHVWTNRPIWPQGLPRPAAPSDDLATARPDLDWRSYNTALSQAMGGRYSVPDHLNWDLFLGPAPEVPYHPIYHPFNWRGWVDWGVGALGDMGAHLIDHPYWALDLGYPRSVEASSSPWGGRRENPASYPAATLVRYEFDAKGDRPAVRMTWYDGGLMPPRHPLLPDDVTLSPVGGVLYIGDRGLLLHGTYAQRPRLFPDDLMAAHSPPSLPGEEISPSHEMNWVDAIKGRAAISSPFDYAAPLTEVMLLGLVALRAGAGRTIHYDPDTMSIPNVPEANQYLHREYRAGWEL